MGCVGVCVAIPVGVPIAVGVSFDVNSFTGKSILDNLLIRVLQPRGSSTYFGIVRISNSFFPPYLVYLEQPSNP